MLEQYQRKKIFYNFYQKEEKMMIMRNIIAGLLFISFTGAMEKPVPVIGDWAHFFMKQVVEADQINDFNFFSSKKDTALEEIIHWAHAFIDNPKEFEELRKQLNIPKAELTQRLYNVINSAKRALELRQINVSKPEAKPIAPVVKPMNPLGHKMRFLYNFVEAEINGDPDNYINTRPASTYEIVIKTASNAMTSNAQLELFQKAFGISEKQVKDLITTVTRKARNGLIELEANKSKEVKVKSQEEKKSPATVASVPQSMSAEYMEARRKIFGLHDHIQEQLSPNKSAQSTFIQGDTIFIVESVLNAANTALKDNELLAMLQQDYKISKPKLIIVLEKIKEDALKELEKREVMVWPQHPNEPEYEHIEGVIKNLSSNVVTVLIPKGPISFEIEKLLPYQNSRSIELSRKPIHLFLMDGNYTITPKEDKVELTKEILFDKKGGKSVPPYIVNGLIKEHPITKFKNFKKSQIIFTITPEKIGIDQQIL